MSIQEARKWMHEQTEKPRLKPVQGWEESVSKPKLEYWQKLYKGDVKK